MDGIKGVEGQSSANDNISRISSPPKHSKAEEKTVKVVAGYPPSDMKVEKESAHTWTRGVSFSSKMAAVADPIIGQHRHETQNELDIEQDKGISQDQLDKAHEKEIKEDHNM